MPEEVKQKVKDPLRRKNDKPGHDKETKDETRGCKREKEKLKQNRE